MAEVTCRKVNADNTRLNHLMVIPILLFAKPLAGLLRWVTSNYAAVIDGGMYADISGVALL
jgi:hypothetical protein